MKTEEKANLSPGAHPCVFSEADAIIEADAVIRGKAVKHTNQKGPDLDQIRRTGGHEPEDVTSGKKIRWIMMSHIVIKNLKNQVEKHLEYASGKHV